MRAFYRRSSIVFSVGLAALFCLGLAQADELTGTPVPIEKGSEILTLQEQASMPNITVAPPPPELADLERHLAEQENAMQQMERAMEERMASGFHPESFHKFSQDVVIPVVAMTLLFGGPMLLIGVIVVLNHRKRRRHEVNLNLNIDKLLAAGRDIPIELLRGDEPRSADYSDEKILKKGVTNIGVGAGIFIFLALMSGVDVASLAFILIGLGVSRVVVWKLTQANKPQQNQPQD